MKKEKKNHVFENNLILHIKEKLPEFYVYTINVDDNNNLNQLSGSDNDLCAEAYYKIFVAIHKFLRSNRLEDGNSDAFQKQDKDQKKIHDKKNTVNILDWILDLFKG